MDNTRYVKKQAARPQVEKKSTQVHEPEVLLLLSSRGGWARVLEAHPLLINLKVDCLKIILANFYILKCFHFTNRN